jgi:hypothetical protein
MRINLVVTVDVVNDGISLASERNRLSWKGLEMVAGLKEAFRTCGVPATWFLRADNQLEDVYGCPAYLWNAYEPLWRNLHESGDEIAWHPSLYHRDPVSGAYGPDRDPDRCADQLGGLHVSLRARGLTFRSVRIGEGFHSNRTMRTLSDLGFRVDATALPGRKRNDADRAFDWEPTPNEPYHPSGADYRVPAEQEGLPILEVPLTTVPIKASYDPAPRGRYINLAYHGPVFRQGITAHLDSLAHNPRPEVFLATIVHPEEVHEQGRSHPLYALSLFTVQENLTFLIEAIGSRASTCRFLRVHEVVEAFEKQARG